MKRVTRRAFCRRVGAALVAAPFVSMVSGARPARAAAGGAAPCAKRLIVFFTPNGTVHDHWRPAGAGAGFSFPAGSILEPLAAHQDRLLVIDGVDFHGVSNHEAGMAAMLTGGGTASTVGGGASLDQHVAAQVGQGTPFASLEFGVQCSPWGGSNQTRMSYSAPGQYVPPDDDPVHVFQRLFGDASPDVSEPASGPSPQYIRRKSVLDAISGELTALQGQLGYQEREKLQAHLDAVEQLEKSLVGSLGCSAPESPQPVGFWDHASFPAVGKAHMDLMVVALACGLTRVASLQWSHTVSPTVFSWLGLSEGHHSLSHVDDSNPAGIADFVACERWFSEQLVYLLDKLEATPEPDGEGSLLDHTTVLWCKELGDPRLHDCVSVPFVIAGGAGYFSTGRYVGAAGAPHQKLLVSVGHSLGLTDQTFGDPGFGTGPLAGLT